MQISDVIGPAGAYEANALALPSTLCALIVFAAGVSILFHERFSRVGWLHFFLSSAIGAWQVALALAMHSVSPPTGRWWAHATTVAAVFITTFQFHFAVTLAGRSVWRARAVVVVWIIAAGLLALLFGTDTFVQRAHRYSWGWFSWYGPAGWAFIVFTIAVVNACVLLYWNLYRSNPPDSVASLRGRWLLLAVLVGGIGAVDFLPTFGIDILPLGGVALMLGNVINAWTTWRYRLVEITPAFAAQRFMDTMSDGVVVLDQDGMVRLVNPAACEMLGYRSEEMLHASPAAGVGQLLFGHDEVPHFPQAGFVGQERQYQTPAGSRRTLSVSVSLMQEGAREPLAAVVTLRDITAAMAAQEQIHKLAYYDPLTNLPNRQLLKERFSQAMARAERARGQAAVLFLDLDRFKQVNDTLGHEAGDLLLKAVSERITACVRESDLVMRNAESAKDSTLARLGGDEFVLLLSPVERGEDAAKVARRILQSLAQPFRLAGGAEVMSGVSIGISLYPGDGEDADTLMKKADLAMYHAKETGRNDFRLFDPAMNAQALKRIDLEAGLKRALLRNELVLVWEPQYAIDSRAIVGLEARATWRDPIRGRMEVADHVGLAEETGIAGSLFDWTLEAVCTQLDAWRRTGAVDVPASFPASMHQIEHSELLRDPAAVLTAHGLPASALRLCVTDLGRAGSGAVVMDRLRQLGKLGIAIDLDSLGGGPLDLPTLRQVLVERARIDARVLDRLAERGGGTVRPLQALVSLGRGLGLTITATAVSSEQLAAEFGAAGVEQAQGPFFGVAFAAEDVPRLVANGHGSGAGS